MIDQKKVRKCEGDVLLSDFKRKKEERESTAGRNKNHEGLTTSVHSHSSMSSMTEDWPPTPYGGQHQDRQRWPEERAAMPQKKKKIPRPKHNKKYDFSVK